MKKHTEVDLYEALGKVVEENTAFYKDDFEIDKRIIQRAAESDEPDEKRLLWLSRKSGTQCLNEREAFIRDTRDFNTWQFYAQQADDHFVAFVVEPYFIQGKAAIGNLYELDFREHAAEMAKKAVRVSEKEITFEDGFITRTPFNIGWGAVSNLIEEHGKIVKQAAVPQDPDKLHDVLAEQRQKRYAMKEAKREEILLPLPFAEQNAYNAVKEAHPASLICFAQHGYYELYGDDAEKASAVLGTKLLSKELEGGGSVAVTGFRESAWLSGSHRLWKTGEDILLFKNGEIEKDLKAADYIPVGLVIRIDNHPYQIDSVDFKADEVRLHAAAAGVNPQQLTEDIAYIRSYVEETPIPLTKAEIKAVAGKTDGEKKREKLSVRNRLKAEQSAQRKTPSVSKSKGKDMEL